MSNSDRRQMLRLGLVTPIALALVALALGGRGSAVPSATSALAAAPSLAVSDCLEVEPGDTFTLAISAAGVTNLLAWDIYYAYDEDLLEVVGKSVREFLAQEPNSNVFDFSDPVPNTSGVYHIGAADTGGAGTEEAGSGVLAVLTLRAKAKGLSWSSLLRIDADGNGTADFGPTLAEAGGGHLGDSNGDGVFDGPISNGQIAIGRSCNETPPTPPPDVIVNPPENTPAVTGATPTPPVGGGTPGPDGSGAPPSNPPSPTHSGGTALSSPRPTPTRIDVPRNGGGSGGDGGGLSPLLAAVIGAAGGVGLVASYIILKAVRRPV